MSRRVALVLLLGIGGACESRELGHGGGPPVQNVEEVKETVPKEKLTAAQPIVELPLKGRQPAVVSLPLGATGKKPILVAAHGRDDLPRPLCEMWRGIVGDRAFVVCPTGIASQSLPGFFTYADHETLSDEIDDALEALRAKFPEHADDGPIVYAGFSLGSFHGVRAVNKDPAKTPRVILIEGGHDPWNEDVVASFADRGGLRVLFVTGQAIHEQRSQKVAADLQRVGIGARVVHAEGAGHTYGGPVREQIAEAFDWVVEGDERWKK